MLEEDAMKISKDFCEKEQNDVKQRVPGTSFYDEVTEDMFDQSLQGSES